MQTRRSFIGNAALGALASSALAKAVAQTPETAARSMRTTRRFQKGFMWATLRSKTAEKLSVLEKFRLLAAAGFDGVEVPSAMDQAEILAAMKDTGLKIPSVVVATHWLKPLTDPSASVREVGLEGLRQALRDAKAYGASSVLLVPGKVTKEVSYADAYTRSREEIAKAIPLAESLGVIIAIENVWNQFLLSPLEAVRYVDSFKSPRVRWHFDVGNVVYYGFPEQWIRILGHRIVKVHVKEYSRKICEEHGPRAGFKIDLMEGDSDWPAVMLALDQVGYSGWLITEQYHPPTMADADWLKHLSSKLDAIIAV
ncbi:MAG: sugar phosphate isomerase/epimerase [Opitutaceae bacterium]|nr:sugar phosphate isomerase/epimerase [Opitutaceae bacterium]